MPNIASILKEEIVRLARKELRSETEGLKKASAQYRSEIAALKRRVVALEKQLAGLSKRASNKVTPKADPETATGVRFSAKGLAKHRQRLGLTAEHMGTLLGVSAQTVYNWEAGKTRPRQQQMTTISAVRSLGKKQASALLENSPK